MGALELKRLHGFSPNFQGMFKTKGTRHDKVLKRIWKQLLPWQHFDDFSVLKFVGALELKPLHGFSPNFQGMFNTRGAHNY